MNSGCQKEGSSLKSLQNGCYIQVFSVPSWYSDSVYYTDHKISLIKKSYRNHSEKSTTSRFEYHDNEVNIYVRDFYWGSWRDVIYYTLSFEDSRISQIETNIGRVKANYFYENNALKYILYYRENKLSDSIAVQWDLNGNNITRSMWFKFDQEIKKYKLANTANYSYDDKNNPHKNSIHFLYDFYDCEEYSLDYFNVNNLKTIKSNIHNIHSDYTYNEYNYPTYVVFYDETNEETDRNSIIYDCK
jgi:hypothetical protein